MRLRPLLQQAELFLFRNPSAGAGVFTILKSANRSRHGLQRSLACWIAGPGLLVLDCRAWIAGAGSTGLDRRVEKILDKVLKA
jgi:hypothetical protein